MKRIILLGFITLLLASCGADRIVKLDSIENMKEISGTVSFVGFQVPNPVASWSENVGRGGSRHSILFNRPEEVFAHFLTGLSPEIRSKISYKDFENEQTTPFNGNNEIKYSRLSNFIAIYDSHSGNSMDEYCLSNLNKTIKADYYLLVIGDIQYFHPWKHTDRNMTPRISIIVYDKNGAKVFVKNYDQKFTGILEDMQQESTCYKYMIQTVASNRVDILADMQILSDAKKPQGQTLEDLYERRYKITQKLAMND